MVGPNVAAATHQFAYVVALLSACFLTGHELELLLQQPRQIGSNAAVPETIKYTTSSPSSLNATLHRAHELARIQQLATAFAKEMTALENPKQIYQFDMHQLRPRNSDVDALDDVPPNANVTSFHTPGITTTIVQGMVRQRFILPGDEHPSFVSFLAVRVVGAWEAISVLVAVGTRNLDSGGCLQWPNDARASAELAWADNQGVQHRVTLAGTMHGWSRRKIFPAKRGAKSEHQLCYGLINFGIANDADASTLPSFIWRNRVAMRVYHDFSGRGGGNSAINFDIEARSALPRPRISLCLDALFGNVREAALEFLAFQHVIGIEVSSKIFYDAHQI